MTKKIPGSEQQELRTEAERRLGQRTALSIQWTWDASDLVHELDVHHIEIERLCCLNWRHDKLRAGVV